MKFIKNLMIFSLILFVGLSVVCAADNTTEQSDNTEFTPIESDINSNQEISQTKGATPPITTTNTVTVTSTSDISTINDNTKYDIQSNLNLGTITASNLNNVIITSTTGAELTNSAFALSGTNLQISYLTFKNTNFNNPITITDSNNVIINNNTINNRDENYEDTFGINIATSNYVTVKGNKVNVSSCPQGMNWFGPGNLYGAPTVSGIIINNTNNTDVICNNVTVNSTALTAAYTYSTFDGIVVINNSQNDNIKYNNVSVNGSEYIYGISLSYYVDTINIKYNDIIVNGSNHVAGIQASSTTNSKIKGNNILGNCTATSGTTASAEAFAYGIILSTELYQSSVCESYYNEIKDNTINLNSTIAYAIELNNADYNNVTNNNVHTYGNVTMGIGMYNSSYNNITDNTLIITGETITLNSNIYEAIYPEITGIKINETSNYNSISGNHVHVFDDSTTVTYSIVLVASDNTVNNNFLTSVYKVIGNSGNFIETSLTPYTNPSTIYQNGYTNNIGTNDAYQ